MDILLVSSFLPYPLHSGGQVRLFNLLKKLSLRHKITLICETRSLKEQDLGPVKKLCKKVIAVRRGPQWTFKNIVKTGFSSYPFLLTGHKNAAMTKQINEELKNNHYDLIHAETFYCMHNLPKTNLPIVLTEHNIEFQVYRRWFNHFTYRFLIPFLLLDIFKMRLWEESYWQKADYVVAVSSRDGQSIEKISKKKVAVVSNGVDSSYFLQVKKEEPPIPAVIFCGSFKWFQNIDAANYLLNKLWAGINKKMNGFVKLKIVGNAASQTIKYKGENVEIEDSVSDIRDVYKKGTVLLAPIRIGGGTKFKILESMASGLPVVTTPIGAEGLEHADNGLMVAASRENLIEETVSLLKDEKLRKSQAKKAQIFVQKNYDWEQIAQRMEEVYQKAHKTYENRH